VTCVVGLVANDNVIIGADSSAVAGCERVARTSTEQKLFRRGEFLIGYTGSIRAGQVLQYRLELPEHPEGVDDTTYLYELFVPAVQRALEVNAGLKINDESDGWAVLFGYRKGLYYLCHDLSLCNVLTYDAIGCGKMFASGSMYTTLTTVHVGPMQRVQLALKAAAAHDIHVEAPFTIEWLVEEGTDRG